MPKLDDLIKIHTSSELRGLNKLLKSWSEVVTDYCRDDLENNCWWHTERANISTLAGAAWRLNEGWIALEEFSTKKRHRIIVDQEVKRKKPYANGRCDLFVSHKSTSFAMEAKQAWKRMNEGNRLFKDAVSEAMKSAIVDADNLVPDEANILLGIVFSAPRIPLSKVAKKNDSSQADSVITRSYVENWIKSSELNQYDAWAYVFPAKCEKLINITGKSVFPGVLLTINQVKLRHKRSRI